jgi:hypothetical protein
VHQGRCRAYMYVLAVEEVLEAWPEGRERQRCWVRGGGGGGWGEGGRREEEAARQRCPLVVAVC